MSLEPSKWERQPEGGIGFSAGQPVLLDIVLAAEAVFPGVPHGELCFKMSSSRPDMLFLDKHRHEKPVDLRSELSCPLVPFSSLAQAVGQAKDVRADDFSKVKVFWLNHRLVMNIEK
jgi:hypothetical protein